MRRIIARSQPSVQMNVRKGWYKFCSCSTSAACGYSARSPMQGLVLRRRGVAVLHAVRRVAADRRARARGGDHARAAQRARRAADRGGRGRRPPRRGDHGPPGRGGGRAGGDRRPARRPPAHGRLRVRRRDADAARDRRLPPEAPGRRAVDEHVRARGLRAAAAQRRARPGDRLRVGRHARRRRHPPRAPDRGPDVPRAAARPPAGQPPPRAARRPRRRGVDRRPARLRVQPADLARVRDRRLRARGSPSRPTTTRPCRASWPPASASR